MAPAARSSAARSGGGAPAVRRIRSGGRRLVEVLAAAQADDPWVAWTLPDRGAQRALLALFLRTTAFPHGEVLVAGDPVDGVAVLLPPDAPAVASPEVGAEVVALHGRRIGRALDADAVIDRHRPAGPAWLLHTLGVAPAAQGRGVGAALVAACAERAAADGRGPLEVETSSERARRFYLRCGFAERARVVLSEGHGLPPDAPTVWLLTHG